MDTASDLAKLAVSLSGLGRAREAHRILGKALALEPDNPDALCAAAAEHLRRGELAPADALGRRGAELAPLHPLLPNLARDLGLALYAASLWEDAEPWLSRSAALEPWNPAVAAALARVRRPAHLAPEILDPRSGRRLERYAPREGDAYIYVIDVVGTCNLRCPTCPVGNSEMRPRGFMDFDLFERIVAKIRRESPSPSPQVNLYNWGEPLLHPKLPQMIRRIRELGMRAFLSSNLNIKRGLKAVIEADPDELKISISGFSPETYARAHVRGNLALVKANMRAVRAYIDETGARTRVWVGHHIYRTNAHEMAPLRELCAELGFAYHPVNAFYMPLERLIETLQGRPNPRDNGIVADLLRHPSETNAAAAAHRSGRHDCELRFNQTVINHDGTVALCCSVYDGDNMLGVDFLDEDFAALEARKYDHPFCDRCFASNTYYAPAELKLIGRALAHADNG